jgi:glycosyltransferase involved in cell wall biosynthesis
MHQSESRLPGISIGLPVYNGEKFLRKKIESMISQTYQNFELIISDNASTDSTQEICQEFANKDKRIHYFRQEKNMGVVWNFGFVLDKAQYNYFIWTAVDDVIVPEFLEKNLTVLLKNENVVASIGLVEQYSLAEDQTEINIIDLRFKKFLKKLSTSLKTIGTYSLYGPYEKKARTYLKRSTCQLVYGLYRTDKLRRRHVYAKFLGNDWTIVLNVLREGDYHVIDEVMMYRYGSTSESGMFNIARMFNERNLGIILPFYPLTCWCLKNLGIRFFIKNLDYFIQINIEGSFSLWIDLIRLFVHKITRK